MRSYWETKLMQSMFSRFPVLEPLTVSSEAGTETGDTKITITPAKAADTNIYKYKIADAAIDVELDENVQTWTLWDGKADITAGTGSVITIVEASAEYKAKKAGSATVIAAG